MLENRRVIKSHKEKIEKISKKSLGIQLKGLNMEPLQTTRQFFIWCCVYPTDGNTSKLKKCLYITFMLTIVISESVFLVGTIKFSVTSASTEAAIYAVFIIIGHSTSLYRFISSMILRHKIVAIFKQLTRIFNTGIS